MILLNDVVVSLFLLGGNLFPYCMMNKKCHFDVLFLCCVFIYLFIIPHLYSTLFKNKIMLKSALQSTIKYDT